MIVFARAFCVLVLAIGTAGVLLTLPGSIWHEEIGRLLSPAVTLTVAGIAGLVTLAATVTWRDERARQVEAEHRSKRAETYAELIADLVRAFTTDKKSDLALQRATLVLWGSDATLRAFAEWNTFATRAGEGYLTPEGRAEARRLIAGAVVQARVDLGGRDRVSPLEIEKVIFNDADLHEVASPGQPHATPPSA